MNLGLPSVVILVHNNKTIDGPKEYKRHCYNTYYAELSKKKCCDLKEKKRGKKLVAVVKNLCNDFH